MLYTQWYKNNYQTYLPIITKWHLCHRLYRLEYFIFQSKLANFCMYMSPNTSYESSIPCRTNISTWRISTALCTKVLLDNESRHFLIKSDTHNVWYLRKQQFAYHLQLIWRFHNKHNRCWLSYLSHYLVTLFVSRGKRAFVPTVLLFFCETAWSPRETHPCIGKEIWLSELTLLFTDILSPSFFFI